MRPSHSTKLARGLCVAALMTAGAGVGTAQNAPAVPLRQYEAPPASALDLASMKARADLVFQGQVLDVRYVKSSAGRPGHTPLPHTFVTYRVDAVLAGTYAGKVATLRLLGGFDPERGEYLRASTAPQFDVGDTDILFVAGNGSRIVPLVGSDSGRLRVIEGRVYDETGRALKLDPAGRVLLGERHAFEETRTTRIQGQPDVQRIAFGPQPIVGAGDGAPVEAFQAAILAALVERPTGGPFVTADARVPFFGPDFTPVPPPQNGPAAAPTSPEEQRELSRQAAERCAPVRERPGAGTSTTERSSTRDSAGERE